MILSTLWSRAEDIRCSPSTLIAFDCSIILGGIGGWRPKSVVSIKYEQVQFAWVRDPFDPQITRLAATVTIRHVKQRQNRIQRGQRSEYVHIYSYGSCGVPGLILVLGSNSPSQRCLAVNSASSPSGFRERWQTTRSRLDSRRPAKFSARSRLSQALTTSRCSGSQTQRTNPSIPCLTTPTGLSGTALCLCQGFVTRTPCGPTL